jgi:hypothetical protein
LDLHTKWQVVINAIIQNCPQRCICRSWHGQQVFLDKLSLPCLFSRVYAWSTSFPWHVYFLVCTVNKFSLTSLLSRVYSQQAFLDKFTFSCVQSTSFPWQVYFLVCTVSKFSLTSLLSRVYSQRVFLDKFTFSCVQSASFPWQVYFLVCAVNKFSLTFSCVQSTSFPWQVFLTSLVSCVYEITSRPSFVYQNHRSGHMHGLAAICTNKFSLSKSWHDQLWNKVPWQGKVTRFKRRIYCMYALKTNILFHLFMTTVYSIF